MPRTVKNEVESVPASEKCPQRAICDQLRRRTLVRQLQQAQLMMPVATMAAGLAHDFKNLMTTISLHCDLIGMSLPGDAAQQGSVAYVRQAVKQSNELLDRLFQVVRPRKGRPIPLRLEEELGAMDCLVRGVSGPDVKVVMLLDTASPVRIDRTELQQIVLNCVSNATQAMKGMGVIEVRVRRVELGRAMANAFEPPVSEGAYTELSIRDTGPGFDRAAVCQSGKLRSPRPTGTRWGIGLSVIEACAARANGAVKISSHRGHGTCVTIVLPAVRARRRRR